jgi:hypothetical protein
MMRKMEYLLLMHVLVIVKIGAPVTTMDFGRGMVVVIFSMSKGVIKAPTLTFMVTTTKSMSIGKAAIKQDLRQDTAFCQAV